MSEITWTVTEANGERKVVSGWDPLPYREALDITEKMPKGQAEFARGWNEMRERLLALGEMKPK